MNACDPICTRSPCHDPPSSRALLDQTRYTVAILIKCVHIQLHGLGVLALPPPLIDTDISILVECLIILLHHIPPCCVLLHDFIDFAASLHPKEVASVRTMQAAAQASGLRHGISHQQCCSGLQRRMLSASWHHVYKRTGANDLCNGMC